MTLFLPVEIRGNLIFKKVKLFWLGTDSGAFFLLVENILKLGEIQYFNKIPARRRLFLQVNNSFSGLWKSFFLHFSEIPTSDFFFA